MHVSSVDKIDFESQIWPIKWLILSTNNSVCLKTTIGSERNFVLPKTLKGSKIYWMIKCCTYLPFLVGPLSGTTPNSEEYLLSRIAARVMNRQKRQSGIVCRKGGCSPLFVSGSRHRCSQFMKAIEFWRAASNGRNKREVNFPQFSQFSQHIRIAGTQRNGWTKTGNFSKDNLWRFMILNSPLEKAASNLS